MANEETTTRPIPSGGRPKPQSETRPAPTGPVETR